jgi:hypothetical protein
MMGGYAMTQLADNLEEAKQEVVATTRRARRKLAKQTSQAVRETTQAGKELAGKIDRRAAKKAHRAAVLEAAEGKGKRRRWPWLLGIVVIGAAATVVIKNRPRANTEPDMMLRSEDLPKPSKVADTAEQGSNGQHAHTAPRTGQTN